MKWIMAALVVSLLGCSPERRDARRRAPMPDAEGTRFVVVDSAARPLAKLRLRKQHLRVYSEQMTPMGTVLNTQDTFVFQPGQASPVALTGNGAVREFGTSLRIEPMEKGWALFGHDATLLGYIEYVGGWTFRKSYSDRSGWRVEKNRVLDGKRVVCESQSRVERPALTLALCLQELPVEARAVLGVWMETQQPKNG